MGTINEIENAWKLWNVHRKIVEIRKKFVKSSIIMDKINSRENLQLNIWRFRTTTHSTFWGNLKEYHFHFFSSGNPDEQNLDVHILAPSYFFHCPDFDKPYFFIRITIPGLWRGVVQTHQKETKIELCVCVRARIFHFSFPHYKTDIFWLQQHLICWDFHFKTIFLKQNTLVVMPILKCDRKQRMFESYFNGGIYSVCIRV